MKFGKYVRNAVGGAILAVSFLPVADSLKGDYRGGEVGNNLQVAKSSPWVPDIEPSPTFPEIPEEINPYGPCTPKPVYRPGKDVAGDVYTVNKGGCIIYPHPPFDPDQRDLPRDPPRSEWVEGEISYKMGGCIPEPPFGPRPRPRPATPDELFGGNYSTTKMDPDGIEINLPENKGEGVACIGGPAWIHPLMPHIIPGGHKTGDDIVYIDFEEDGGLSYPCRPEPNPEPFEPRPYGPCEPDLAVGDNRKEYLLAADTCEGVRIEIDTPIGDIDICIGKSS